MFRLIVLLFVTFMSVSSAVAENVPLTRDEVSVLKKKLQAVSAAMGQPPAGYAKEDEDFSLPTDTRKGREAGKYEWPHASVNYRFGSSAQKTAKKSQDDISKEYEKKMSEAMAKGDYQALSKLSQEMQQKAGQAHLAEVEGKKDPIGVQIQLNTGTSQAIDPDGVILEKPGVIALALDTQDEKQNRVGLYFDPVSLKETKSLSRIDLKYPEGGVSKKTAVLNVIIELHGPADAVTEWAKRINTSAVLGQIDGK
jgi:hypothetical protein